VRSRALVNRTGQDRYPASKSQQHVVPSAGSPLREPEGSLLFSLTGRFFRGTFSWAVLVAAHAFSQKPIREKESALAPAAGRILSASEG